MYNFLTELCRQQLNDNRSLIVRLYGENIARLKCLNHKPILIMQFMDDDTFANTNKISFHTNRPIPNEKWPWPFRNLGRGHVQVDGYDLLNERGYLLFKVADVHHLYSGDVLDLNPGSVKITL